MLQYVSVVHVSIEPKLTKGFFIIHYSNEAFTINTL